MAEARAARIEREHRRLCAGYGRLLALIAEADEEQDGLLLGHGGTTSLLAKQLRVTRSVAVGMVNEARGLRRCPNTRAALEEGRISPRHLGQILAGVKATAHLDRGAERAEEILLALALEHDAGAVKSAVAGIKQALDPEGVEREHHAKRQRSVCYLSPMLDGMWDLAGTLDPEAGATLATALDALATGYLTATDPPSSGHSSSPTPTPAPTPEPAPDFAPEPDLAPDHALDSDPDIPAERLTGAQRRALALTDLAARAMTAGEVGIHGGTRPHLSVLIPESALHAAPLATTTTATTSYGQDLPPSTAHRLACDCSLTPIRIDGDGLPLNVGRTQRLATTAQRKALAVRDRGCVHSGCRIGPQWCDAHHIVSWLDGGPTDLGNLVLLCRRHHTESHYQQRLAALAALATDRAGASAPAPARSAPTDIRTIHQNPSLALAC